MIWPGRVDTSTTREMQPRDPSAGSPMRHPLADATSHVHEGGSHDRISCNPVMLTARAVPLGKPYRDTSRLIIAPISLC